MKIVEQIQNNETVGFLLRNKRAIIITLILVLGVVAGVYLIQQQQIFKSRAEDTGTKVIDITPDFPNGTTIPTSTSKIQIQIKGF